MTIAKVPRAWAYPARRPVAGVGLRMGEQPADDVEIVGAVVSISGTGLRPRRSSGRGLAPARWMGGSTERSPLCVAVGVGQPGTVLADADRRRGRPDLSLVDGADHGGEKGAASA